MSASLTNLVPLDLRVALRSLGRNAGLVTVAIISLSVGIAAAASMFSVIDTVDFKTPPYPGADRIVGLQEVTPDTETGCPHCRTSVAPITLDAWRSGTHAFSVIAPYHEMLLRWEVNGERELFYASAASPELFALLGASPALGRLIVPEDARPGAEPVVVITDDLWRSRFGSDPHVLGSRMVLIGGISRDAIVVPNRRRAAARVPLWR